jgi:hypothetical protein
MLPADWEEYLASAERDIKKPPNPPRRYQPKVTRHMSRNQRIASGQSSNPIQAIYVPESKWSATPTHPEDWKGTKEVGPGDVNNRTYRAGKATTERQVGYSRTTVRHGHSGRGRPPSKNIDELLKEFDV